MQRLIDANGWMLTPPIPYSYRTVAWDLPVPAPSPPDAQHWLGTDDQARDVLARTIYGFRLSVLFGFTLTIVSAVIGVAAGAVQGYFGGWIDLAFQRFMEVWSSVPTLYVLIILTSIVEPNFWWLLGILLLFSWMGFVGVVRAEFLRARNFDYVRAARALGAVRSGDHGPPRAAERGGGDADLPAVHPRRLGHRADRPRLPRHRPAAGLAVAGRAAGAGQGQPAGAVARPHRLRRHRADAVAADLHRRGGARRLRSAQGDRRDAAGHRASPPASIEPAHQPPRPAE